MHYYKFNIGDYASHTSHLDLMEDLAFRRMLDWMYLHESPLPDSAEQVARLIRMRTHSDCIALVLHEFFELGEHGWFQAKAVKEIELYKSKSEKAKKSAEARWASKAVKTDANALRTECEGNANHKPLTINQEPLKDMLPSTAPSKNTIPVQKIIDIYHEECKSMVSMDVLSPERISAIKSFWNFKSEHKNLDFIREYFAYAESCPFLNGSVPPSNGFRQLKPDIKWLMNINNYAKIREGKYE